MRRIALLLLRLLVGALQWAVVIAIALAILTIASDVAKLAGKGAMPMPDTWREAKQVGCLSQLSKDKFGVSRWRVTVYVDYTGFKWSRLLSMREANERKKALADCNAWLEEVKKRGKGGQR